MENNNGEDCCGYCLEKIEYLLDPRELPCSHVFCLACLQEDFLKNKILECCICKKNHGDVEVDNLVKVEKLVLSDDASEDDHPPGLCDVCKEERKVAVMFCVDCGKSLCVRHDEYHDEYQKAFSRTQHTKIHEEEYRAAPDRYTIRTCPKHEGEELKKTCKNCLKTFCDCCETDKKCAANKGSMHEIEEISKLSQKFKVQLNKLLNSLSSKVSDVYTLEKKTRADLAAMEERTSQMNGEVDRIVGEQIKTIQGNADKLKSEIQLYRLESAKVVSDFVGGLHDKKSHLSGLWKSTNKMLTQKHDTEIMRSYTSTAEDLKSATETTLSTCQLPISRMLIRTGENRKIELELRESIPLKLEFKQRDMRDDDSHCSCIFQATDQNLLCGRDSSISILENTTLKSLKELNTSNVNGIALHKQGYLALHWEDGKNYIILYSRELVFMKLFGEFFRPTDKYSQLCASKDLVLAMDPDEKQLNVYNERGEFQFHTKLSENKRPWGVHALGDGTVLVTDFVGGCLRKYSLKAGKGKALWACLDLLAPVGITTNDSGLIFVSSLSGKRIYIISPKGEKLKELTHPELQNVKEIYDITVNGEIASLACGEDGVIQFQMAFGALVR